ncbi:hypothetical protein [Intestinibacter sp.]|uniref:hypothetical protein n=1 Tax=Intestinibacter sp. TaxID=1965304 RepID=UPI003F14D8DC
MKKLKLLNTISDFTVEELLRFINKYEMTREEYDSHFSNLLDDGILDSKIFNVLSFIELCNLVDFIGNLKESELPITWKFIVEDMNKGILTLDELKEVYLTDKIKAESLLNKAVFINNVIKSFRNEIKKPSTL